MRPNLFCLIGIVAAHGAVGAALLSHDTPRTTETASTYTKTRDPLPYYAPKRDFCAIVVFTMSPDCFIDHCRRMKTRPHGLGIEDADAADLLAADDQSRPDVELERDESSRRYRAALATLPPEQRDVYLLHEESDLSLEEIALVT